MNFFELVVFVSGKRLYKIKKPESNVIVTSCSCIFVSISIQINTFQKSISAYNSKKCIDVCNF